MASLTQNVTLLFYIQRSLLTLEDFKVSLAFGQRWPWGPDAQLNNREMHVEMDIYKTAKMSKNI